MEFLPLEPNWSPLELKIVDDDDNNLFKVLLTIGVHFELEI